MGRKTINITFPFSETVNGGVFATNVTTEKALRDDLVALLTMKKGQRPMRSTLYSPIYDYIMDPLDTIALQRMEEDIRKKVEEFITQIEIQKIDFTVSPENNALNIKTIFTVSGLFGSEQVVEINIPLDETDEIGEEF